MAAETFPKVSPGDPLRISAETWNAVMGLGAALRSGDASTRPADAGLGRLPYGDIWIQNDSGADRAEFEILGLGPVLVDPNDNEDAFLYSPPIWSGEVPVFANGNPEAETDHVGRWAVLLEPIADGVIGKARMLGVIPVTIEVITAVDLRAEIIDGDPTKLRSGAIGSARILWKESGTGDKRALVSFGEGPLGWERGKTDEVLVFPGDAMVSRHAFNGLDWYDTGHDDKVYAPELLGGGAILEDYWIDYAWSHATRRLEVIRREC